MVSIYLPGGPIAQLSNLSFFLAAVFGDVLLIRLFLTLAYVFLLTSAALGIPQWPAVNSTGGIALDTIIWAAASGTLHFVALLRLLADERGIKFRTEDEEQLWRFFYRRSGMGRLEMRQVLRHGRWRRVKAGAVILSPVAACHRLCLMVEGVAEFFAATEDPESLQQSPTRAAVSSSRMLSGTFFDMRLLNVFGLFIGFEGSGQEKWFAAVAKTDCLVYEWSIEELNTMATGCSPAVSHYWRNLLATQVGLNFAWRERPDALPACGTGELESPAVLLGTRSRDFADPLRGYEGVKGPNSVGKLLQLLQWLWCSVNLLMPPGTRHNDLPIHGILARNRIVAIKEAQLRQLARQEEQAAGDGRWRVGEEEEAAAVRTLRQLQSLRQIELVDMVSLARDISIRRMRLRVRGDSSVMSEP